MRPAVKGLLHAAPLALLLWVVIVLAVLALASCAAKVPQWKAYGIEVRDDAPAWPRGDLP